MWRLLLYAIAIVAAVMLVQGLVYPVVTAIAHAAGTTLIAHYWFSAPDWLNLVAVALAHLAMLRWIERRSWADVGLGRSAWRGRALALGGGVGVAAIGVPCALLLLGGLLRVVPAGGGESTVVPLLARLAPAALFEEMLVRGYPFLVLRDSVGTWPALGATSLVFGLLHLQNPGAAAISVLMVTLAGVFLGTVLVVTGSLWAAFAAHLAWNWTLSAIVHAAVSGLPFLAPSYRVIDAGPDWLTGGAWGPEGGLAAGAGMLTALTLMMRHSSLRTRGRTAAGEHSDG